MLLRQGGRDAGSLGAFEHELAAHAVTLVAKRMEGVVALSGLFRAAHARLVPEGESAGLAYGPDSACAPAEEFAAALAHARPRDLLLKSTERGPHRDDLELRLNGRPARQFASEGQQRCLVIALRLAQAAYFQARGGITPVLLCDDVLGELDPERRGKFWDAIEGDPQVIASGTSPPPAGGGWQVLRVAGGIIVPAGGPA